MTPEEQDQLFYLICKKVGISTSRFAIWGSWLMEHPSWKESHIICAYLSDGTHSYSPINPGVTHLGDPVKRIQPFCLSNPSCNVLTCLEELIQKLVVSEAEELASKTAAKNQSLKNTQLDRMELGVPLPGM